jgi:Ca2+-binding RTX toxin-like protein
MAKLTVAKGHYIDMRDFDFDGLLNGDDYVTNSGYFAVHHNYGAMDEFRGDDFSYEGDIPVGGVVTSYAMTEYYDRKYVVDGLDMSVTDLIRAAKTFDLGDDLRVVKAALSGDDVLVGGSFGDCMTGYAGEDRLLGNSGLDYLLGGDGVDILVGGAEHDLLDGGGSSDIFLFLRLSDSSIRNADRIMDFSHREGDRMDLSAIDSNDDRAGNQAFDFIRDHRFTGKAGQLNYEITKGWTHVYGDTDGDGKAEFAIFFEGKMHFGQNDFVL